MEWDPDTHRLLLLTARTSAGLTREELGQRIGVTGQTIYNWETGGSTPRGQSLNELVEEFGEDAFDPDAAVIEDNQPGAFAEWVETNRKENKWSRNELAYRASVSAMTIWNIEAGRTQNPQQSTVERLEAVFGKAVPREADQELKEKTALGLEGVGSFESFDPHDRDNLPQLPGIYVFYDISERPIYVGKAQNIAGRIADTHTGHWDKFWYKSPIVHTGAYVRIDDERLRHQIETVMIRFLKSNAVINKQGVRRDGN